jgi:hypothetical protein
MVQPSPKLRGQMNEVTTKIKDELIKDGLIPHRGAHFELRLNRRGLFVGNQPQPVDLYQKYAALLEELTGTRMEANGSFELSH